MSNANGFWAATERRDNRDDLPLAHEPGRAGANENRPKERFVYHNFRARAVKADEMELTDDEIRAKWTAEYDKEQRDRAAHEKFLLRLEANGVPQHRWNKLLPCEEYGKEPYPLSFAAFIWEWNGEKNPWPEKDLQRLSEAVGRVRQLKRDEVEKYGCDKDGQMVAEAKKKQAEAALKGEPPAPVLTLDEASEILKAARLAIRNEVQKIEAEHRPTIDRIVSKLLDAAAEMADELERQEAQMHEQTDGRFGWPRVPSRTLVSLRQLPWRVSELRANSFADTLERLGLVKPAPKK